jgi:hypothetical protein
LLLAVQADASGAVSPFKFPENDSLRGARSIRLPPLAFGCVQRNAGLRRGRIHQAARNGSGIRIESCPPPYTNV